MMERIKEKESMDSSVDVHAFDAFQKSFIAGWFADNFVDWALNVGMDEGRVLDIGTGSGVIPIKMRHKNPDLEIHGVDISGPMIDMANRNLSEQNLEGKIKFVVGDGVDLPFEDGYFDLVTCNHLIHHLDDPVPLFNEIARVAKDDAGIMIRDVRRQPDKIQFLILKAILNIGLNKEECRMACDSFAAAFTPDELDGYLKRSGLEGARVVRYYMVPNLLEIMMGVERVHQKKRGLKKLFPENATIPFLKFPGKKFLGGGGQVSTFHINGEWPSPILLNLTR